MAMTPTNEPTDRSMLRETMTSTMPVAMMATTVVWTESVTMLAGARILPPVTMPKPIRMAARATSMPKRRRSISVAASIVAARGPAAALDRLWCGAGHVSHGLPSDPGRRSKRPGSR